MARSAVQPSDMTLQDELDTSRTIISAYQVRASHLQTRLLATLDALDTLQHERTAEIQALETANARLARQNKRLQQQINLLEVERDDMKEAVSALVEKVDEINGVDFLSRSRVSLNSFVEPLEQEDGHSLEPALTTRVQTVDHFSPTLFKALSEELTKEKEAHELTRKDAATRIAILQAQLARRDAEIEAHVNSGGVPTDSLPISRGKASIPELTQSQAVAILEDAAKQNRRLEAEVQRLSQELGKLSSRKPPHFPQMQDPRIRTTTISPQHQRALDDLDQNIRSSEADAMELATERMKLAYLDQISPENNMNMEFEQVLLIEDECLRLRRAEQTLASELRALRQEKAASEDRFRAEIEELKQQIQHALPASSKGTSLQLGHPLIEVPSIPPPYVSPAQQATHGPPPRPATPPRHTYIVNNSLPSPPSSTHTVKPRNRRGSDSIARELLSAMEDVREKDRMLGRLKRELEELKARMLDEGSQL